MHYIPLVFGCLLFGGLIGAVIYQHTEHRPLTTKEFLAKRNECHRAGLQLQWREWETAPVGIAGAWCAAASAETAAR